MQYSLSINGLTKSFATNFFQKPRQVLHSVSFKVKSQKTTGFIGVNGAGKTTTLKCVLGFIRPVTGTIGFFDGLPLSAHVKQRIGYLPERPYYYEFLTASEFLKFHWDISGGGEGFEESAQSVLTRVGLMNVWDRSLRSFSKGMLQRAGMAQALIRKPEFLILDEPMSGLDPDGRILIKEIIRHEKARGTSIFFSSHLLNDMDELCDELVVIDQGKMIYEGSLGDFTKSGGVEESFRQLRKELGDRKIEEN